MTGARTAKEPIMFDALPGGRVAPDVVVVISSPIFGARALTSTPLHATRGGA